jgi:hypothetical protein
MNHRLQWTWLKAVSAVFLASVMLAGASPAHAVVDGSARGQSAAPTYVQDCERTYGSWYFKVECDGGNQQYRAAVKCDGVLWDTYWRYGNFMWPNSWYSIASCDYGHSVISSQLQVR